MRRDAKRRAAWAAGRKHHELLRTDERREAHARHGASYALMPDMPHVSDDAPHGYLTGMTARRSRMKRSSAAKRIALTARDIEIFQLLRRYRYLRSTYLHAFAGGASATRFKERLGDLFHEGYLDRPERQWKFAGSRYQPAIHELGAEGGRALQGMG